MAGENRDENGHVQYSLDGVQKTILLYAVDFAKAHLDQFAAHYDLDVCDEDMSDLAQLIKDATGLTLLPPQTN
jgi:hypothetical protein